jgi:ankyrin repeat protein
MMRCLVKKLGADVNQVTRDCITPLMFASSHDNQHAVVWLFKNGGDPRASHSNSSTAADISKSMGAPTEQTVYI